MEKKALKGKKKKSKRGREFREQGKKRSVGEDSRKKKKDRGEGEKRE